MCLKKEIKEHDENSLNDYFETVKDNMSEEYFSMLNNTINGIKNRELSKKKKVFKKYGIK